MVHQVPEEIHEFYMEFRTHYPGNVVVSVKNGSCGGCFMKLLPQWLVQVHLGQEIVHCNRCQRILAFDEDFDPDNPAVTEVK
jgi:predicted  nucleic acid-binding Zn-ribbon protein